MPASESTASMRPTRVGLSCECTSLTNTPRVLANLRTQPAGQNTNAPKALMKFRLLSTARYFWWSALDLQRYNAGMKHDPLWMADQVTYQIFPDRFAIGKPHTSETKLK